MKRRITELDELKEIELSIMEKVHTFCTENNLRYVLSYGTLLGAVRHKGFIPWDDDIDIFMPRPDYEKFLDTFDEYGEKNGLFTSSIRSKNVFIRNFAQVCDATTELHEPWSTENTVRGVFIDIWPLDGLPANKLVRKIHIFKLKLYRNIIIATLIKKENTKKYSLIKRIFRAVFHHADGLKTAQKVTKLCKKYDYDSSELVASTGTNMSIYRRSLFDNIILQPFENLQFNIPEDYDTILTTQYGDYMKLPPEDKRNPHHEFEAFRIE